MAKVKSYNELLTAFTNNADKVVRPNDQGQITREEAVQLFELIRWVPDLYFCTPDEGCDVRTTLIRALLKALDVKNFHVEVNLTPPIKIGEETFNWYNHIATGIQLSDNFVQSAEGSSMLILDPALATEPLEVRDWQNILGVTPPNIYIKSDEHPLVNLEVGLEILKDQIRPFRV